MDSRGMLKASTTIFLSLCVAALTGCASSGDSSQASVVGAQPTKRPIETASQRRADAKRTAQQHRAEAARMTAQRRADAAADAENKRQARIPMYNYWTTNSKNLDAASASARAAAQAIQDDDTVTASSDFSDCAAKAEAALLPPEDNVPDGWDEVKNALENAASHLEDSCKAAVSALDDGKPSEVAEAKAKMDEFEIAQIAAVGKALELWTKAGGDPNNL